MSSMKQWRGLKALVQEVVENGSSAIQEVHLRTASRPFTVLEHIPPIAAPARAVHAVHDAAASTVYGSIRLATRAVGAGLDHVLDALEKGQDPQPSSAGDEGEREADERG